MLFLTQLPYRNKKVVDSITSVEPSQFSYCISKPYDADRMQPNDELSLGEFANNKKPPC